MTPFANLNRRNNNNHETLFSHVYNARILCRTLRTAIAAGMRTGGTYWRKYGMLSVSNRSCDKSRNLVSANTSQDENIRKAGSGMVEVLTETVIGLQEKSRVR